MSKSKLPHYSQMIKRFLADGDASPDEYLKALKRLDYIKYSHDSYSLTGNGREQAIRLGYIKETADVRAGKLAIGIDPASPDGEGGAFVVMEHKDGKARVVTSGTLSKKSLEDARSILEPAGKAHLLDEADILGAPLEVADGEHDAYLIWVGAEHYPTIESFVAEAEKMGVSKRMSNPAVCRSVVESKLPVLLAHDEGKRRECPACLTSIDCPVCRKTIEAIKRLELEIEVDKSLSETLVERRRAKIKGLRETPCGACGDAGKITSGSGGHVVFANGVRWDYREYNYWLHQPAKIHSLGLEGLREGITSLEQFVAEDHMCEECGGRGELPEGVVFGLFFPSGMEYIESTDAKTTEIRAKEGFTVVSAATLASEKKRGCGKRKAGGVYTVGSDLAVSTKAVAALKEAGADLRGPLVQLVEPVKVDFRRFRGVKLVKTEGDLATELKMIKEALE